MNALIKISLLSVMILVSLSAYLRLSHSGIGCPDWPSCYGRIGVPEQVTEVISKENAYQRILAEAQQPLAWATPLHRFVASILGLFIVFLVMLAIKNKRDILLSLVLLVITVYLALLGLKSGGLHSPAVVMGNLGGGFLMLGLLGWMLFKRQPVPETLEKKRLPGVLLGTATLVLVLQILLGGLTSANFAATSCQSLPDCHGSWLPGLDVFKAMDLSTEHEVTASGQVIGGQERIDIHITHRIFAVITALLLVVVGSMALKAGPGLRLTGGIIILLVLTEFTIGALAIAADIPIAMAVAHNWLAGLLLLALLKLVALNRSMSSL
jgi:cytochrome c oxidase assembly protein subunit 15